MIFEDFLRLVGDEPVFTSAVLKTHGIPARRIRLQLVRWVKSGRLVRLRRGVYTLGEPYRRGAPHPFLAANLLKRASYVSLHSALAYYGLIPESVPAVTSVTTLRPERLATPVGFFIFRNVRKPMFHGFRAVEVAPAQTAFVALPEKALLDLVHLTPKADTNAYLEELRLENLERLDRHYLMDMARSSGSPKLVRAAQWLVRRAGDEGGLEP